MGSARKIYETEKTQTTDAVQFIFISSGKTDIVKAVQYHRVEDLWDLPLFNLGFGNYDILTDEISDEAISNNSDTYKVFHTVLSTIPPFFEIYPRAILMVQGSDSNSIFEKSCRENCSRNCFAICKKLHRRINVYRQYIDGHFEYLSQYYNFFGSVEGGHNQSIEAYVSNRNYIKVFLQKNLCKFTS